MMKAILLSIKSHPKLFGGIIVGVLLAGSLWYIDHRKDEYEKTISELRADLKDSEKFIEDQKQEFDDYKIEMSTSITEQALRLSESRREASEKISQLEGQVDDLKDKTADTYSEDNCEAAEMLIDEELGLD